MAKELPYFKFHINEWLNGDITLEDYELQGIFVNICAYYWSKDCDLSKPNLLKKFRGLEGKIEQLIQSDVIKVVGQNVRIHFLNEQYGSKEVQKIANRQNGLLGGRPRKEKTEEKPNGFNFANRNETETKANGNPNITNIEESIGDKSINNTNSIVAPKVASLSLEDRKKAFRETLVPFAKSDKNPNGKFDKEMVKDFFEKWTEPATKSKNKMRFELEKSWDAALRLKTWERNGFGKKKEYTNEKSTQGSQLSIPN